MSIRELKFRAWDTVSESMLSWYELAHLSKVKLYYLEGETNLKWMQYTGLKDKNGKYIYDGDIISGQSSNPFGLKEVKNYKIIWGVDRWHAEGTTFDNLQEFLNSLDMKCEVIGNIYENPELLN